MSQGPVQVAIIGGGCASIAAAFELTAPELRGAYQVTVYQQGFRLGGKGASGRGGCDRIEEHGLHLWMGFYENAFRMMRRCYAELERDPLRCPIARFEQAFAPAETTAVADRTADGPWSFWQVLFPPVDGQPGDAPNASARPSVAHYLARCLTLLRSLLDSLDSFERGGEGLDPGSLPERARRYAGLVGLAAMREAFATLEVALRSTPLAALQGLARLPKSLTDSVHARIEQASGEDARVRRLWEIVDLVLAVVRGCIRGRLLTDPRGFDAIDDYDCRQWLRLNGASESAIDSAFVRGLYDLAFAYEDGDLERPRIAAGQALRGALRAFFTYRGAFFYKMTAGMGDIVFAPLYELLSRRGVRFEFFHRLRDVGVAHDDGDELPHVATLVFDLQAEVRDGKPYAPLVDVRGLPCWPAQPDYAQLQEGEHLRESGVRFESHWETRAVRQKTLRAGEDFDAVVLGVGLSALPHVARELIDHDSRFAEMIATCKTVPTQAFQLWLDADLRQLGWRHGSVALSAFVEPFDTWADMTHLAEQESWPTPPRSIAYFCSVLPDASPDEQGDEGYPERRTAEVRESALRFLDRDVVALWPKAAKDGRFRYELLRAEAGPASARTADGPPRFDTQYLTANVNPSDRYALSLPGTLRHRVSPLERRFDNLTVAGDWTRCGFNEGCVEAAVMSGRLAAHALSGFPALSEITGFDHP